MRPKLITEKNPTLQTQKTLEAASVPHDEMPEPERTWLIQVAPSTSMFSGWGPRMESSINAVLRSRN